MSSRQTLPTLWLLTDRRLGADLWGCIARLPEGGGVVLRHHDLNLERARRVAALCRERNLLLAVAADIALARTMGAPMVHNPVGDSSGLLVSRSVHNGDEAAAARRADCLFVSPLHPSASHPGAEALGLDAAVALAAMARVPAIALGGMNAARGADAMAAGFHGWAAIDAWRGSGA